MSLTLRIPRALVSPNVWNGRHWRVKHRLSQEWEGEIGWAVVALQAREHGAAAAETTAALMRWAKGREVPMPMRKRIRVAITREVPSKRNFIRDDDNLRFCVKPVLDALKRAGYIVNDSRNWIELPTPEQRVSTDGQYWTEIALTPVVAKEPA